MSVALARDARAEVYADLRHMIANIVRNFCHSYRQDFDDMMGIAHVAFCEAFTNYDPSRATFGTHVCQKVWSKIYEDFRRRGCRAELLKEYTSLECTLDNAEWQWCSDRSSFALTDLLDELSDDAKQVVQLTLAAPIDLVHAVHDRGKGKPDHVRNALTEVLIDFGWSIDRVSESFAEIAGAL